MVKLERIKTYFINLLTQGTAPSKLAACVAVAFAIGLFPVLGSTTLLATGAAFLFRFNLPATQIVNYAVYPLQLLLLIPFMKAGEYFFGVATLNFSFEEIFELLKTDIPLMISLLWDVTMQAIGAWLLIMPLVSLLLFFVLRIAFIKTEKIFKIKKAHKTVRLK